MTRRKTKEEKIKSLYRLKNFRILESERQEVKDVQTFGYLDSKYVVRDLVKTIVVSSFMVGLIFFAKKYLG